MLQLSILGISLLIRLSNTPFDYCLLIKESGMNPFIRDIAHRLQDKFHHIVGYFFCINNNKVFFDSFPDYSDNCRAMSDYLLETSDYKIYWAVKIIPTFDTDARIHFVQKSDKWKYIYHTLTSKYLFSTHGAFGWANPKRQMFVCFWHGTMLKRIAYMQDPIRNKYSNRSPRYFSAPSEFYMPLFAKSFNRGVEDILLTGFPRIDFLLEDNDSFSKLGIDSSLYKKVIMYLPTFRQPMGGGYTDTNRNIFQDDVINFLDESSLKKWNDFFDKHGILLMVKPHPSDKNQLSNITYSNIRIVPHSVLLEKDIQLYSLLRYSDALITDFSSVYCDYLVLDRPIGFMLSDIDDYSKGRGFVFDKPLDVLPGFKIWGESDFVNFINEVSEDIDSTKQLRLKLQPMYNKYVDGCFCERIARIINMNVKA